MQDKTMEQPQPEWWALVLKWAAINTPGFFIAGTCWKLIDATSKFMTRMVDGSLKRVANSAMEEKSKELKVDIDKIDEKLNHLINSLIDKKK